MLTPAKFNMLTPLPESVSLNNAFMLFEGKELFYVYKNVPHIITVPRVHPTDGTTLECILKSHTVWKEDANHIVMLRKADVLHIYTEDELDFIQRMCRHHFQDRTLAIATPDEMKKLDGTRYVVGRSLLETEAF